MNRKWQKYIDTPIVEVTSKWVESGKNTLKHTKANYFYHIYFLLRNFVIVYWFLCFYMLFSVFWKYYKNPLCIQWENYLFFHKNTLIWKFSKFTVCVHRWNCELSAFLSKMTKIAKIIIILFDKTPKNEKTRKIKYFDIFKNCPT